MVRGLVVTFTFFRGVFAVSFVCFILSAAMSAQAADDDDDYGGPYVPAWTRTGGPDFPNTAEFSGGSAGPAMNGGGVAADDPRLINNTFLREYSRVEISSYDCSLETRTKNSGECTIDLKKDGTVVSLNAATEIIANYGNTAAFPARDLNVIVTVHSEVTGNELPVTGEILEIKDHAGRTIAKKIDQRLRR